MLPKIDPKTFKFTKTEGQHTIAIIPPIAIDSYWNEIQAELEKNPELWNVAHTIESLREHILNDWIKVWGIWDKDNKAKMYFFTLVEEYPVVKIMRMVWASGSHLQDYIHMALATLDEYMKFRGCDIGILDGREGWGPILAPFGYSRLQTSFFKRAPASRMN